MALPRRHPQLSLSWEALIHLVGRPRHLILNCFRIVVAEQFSSSSEIHSSEVFSASENIADAGAVVSEVDCFFASGRWVWKPSRTPWTLHYYLMNTYIVDAHFEFFLRAICFKCKTPAELAQYLHHFVKAEKQNPLDIGLGLNLLFTSFLPVLLQNPTSIVYPSLQPDPDDLTSSLPSPLPSPPQQSDASTPTSPDKQNGQAAKEDGSSGDVDTSPDSTFFPPKAVLEESGAFIKLMLETLSNLLRSPAIISRQVFEFLVEHVVRLLLVQNSKFGGFSNSDQEISRAYLCKIKPNIVIPFLAQFYGGVPPQHLAAHLQQLLQAKDRQTFLDTLNLITALGFQDKFDPKKVLERSIKSNTINEAKKFVKGDPTRTSLFINMLTTNQNVKQAADIIKEFKLSPAHFPKVVERVQKVASRYYMSRFLKNKPSDADYLSLARIEELFDGMTSMLAYSVQDLEYHGFISEAAYFVLKHKLQPHIRQDSLASLQKQIMFKLSLPPESTLEECLAKAADQADLGGVLTDTFGPVQKQEPNKLPLMHLEKPVTMVTEVDQIENMKAKLSKGSVVGMDMEWKPVFTKFDKSQAAVLQIANEEEVFIVDLIALHDKKELDEALSSIFKNKGITKLGFSFSSDMSMVLKSYPQLECFRLITPFVDIQRQYKEVYGCSQQISLAKASEALLQYRICKRETSSNWERRPLRKSQMHYAALDAYVLIPMHERLSDMTDIPAIETLSLNKQDSEQSEELKEKPPVVEEQGVTANLYAMKSREATTPKRSKDLEAKNIESPGALLSQVFVLDQGTAGLNKFLSQLKLKTEVRRDKFKALMGSMKKGEVLLTGHEKIYSASVGPTILFKERNAFKQLEQLCTYLELEQPSEKTEYDPGELWA